MLKRPAQYPLPRGYKLLATVLLTLSLLAAPLAAVAQSGVYVVPWLTVEQVYDDNIFFQSEDEVSDYITRVSPQLDVGYDSETLNWLLSYRNDAEWYNDLSELDDSTARGFGLATIEYEPNRRWTLTGRGEYVQTNTAQDLTLTPGGELPGRVGRAEAERLAFAGGAKYQFTPKLAGDFLVSWVEDDLIDVSINEVWSANAVLDQSLTPARLLRYGYEFRDYSFESLVVPEPPIVTDPSGSVDSHTLWVGLRESVSERSDLEVRAGPRISDGDVDPYFLFNWRRGYDRGETSVELLWDETQFLGEAGRQETRSIYGAWRHEFTSDIEVSAGAGYAYLDGNDFTTDIASFDVSGIYRFNRFVFVTARYGVNAQEQDFDLFPSERITHNIVSLALTFVRPRPGTEEGSL
jgi:hypothetical protein